MMSPRDIHAMRWRLPRFVLFGTHLVPTSIGYSSWRRWITGLQAMGPRVHVAGPINSWTMNTKSVLPWSPDVVVAFAREFSPCMGYLFWRHAGQEDGRQVVIGRHPEDDILHAHIANRLLVYDPYQQAIIVDRHPEIAVVSPLSTTTMPSSASGGHRLSTLFEVAAVRQ